MSMKLAVVGCGHVGLVTAAGFAEVGHTVVGLDTDAQKLELLRRGEAPFYEPGLQDLLDRHHGDRLSFESDPVRAFEDVDVAFICVATPPRSDGTLSLAFVEQSTRTVAEAARGPLVIVEKSTVPVQTARRVMAVLKEEGRYPEIDVATNPEFLREGSAVHDALNPDRIVVGLAGNGRTEEVLRELYRPIVETAGCPLIVTDLDTAEMIKHACNSFLATKISFVNAVAEMCEKVGADVEVVSRAMGLDPRIGPHFLQAGVGYGGSCFPKDVSQFIAQGSELGVDLSMLESVRRINTTQRARLMTKLKAAVWNLEGKTIAVWGLAFKPGTDDLREAPALDIIPALEAEGAHVVAYDPAAGPAAKAFFPNLRIAPDAMAALEGADALVVLTDWPEFAAADHDQVKAALRRPVVVDGRNLWPVDRMAAGGFTYLSFGRPDVIAGEIRRP